MELSSYYRWGTLPSEEEYEKHEFSGDYTLLCSRNDLTLLNGQPLSMPLKAAIECDGEGIVPDHFEVQGIHWIRSEWRHVLDENAAGELEYVSAPVYLRGTRKKLAEGFLLNHLENVDCIDLSRSPHRCTEGAVYGYVFYCEPKLLRACIPVNRKIFRLHLSLHVVLHEDLVKLIKKSGFIGTRFNQMVVE